MCGVWSIARGVICKTGQCVWNIVRGVICKTGQCVWSMEYCKGCNM